MCCLGCVGDDGGVNGRWLGPGRVHMRTVRQDARFSVDSGLC